MSPSTRLMASALGGDRRALERLLCYPALSREVEHHRVAPSLARLATELAVSGSCLETFQAARQASQRVNSSAASAQAELAGALAMAGVRWCPLVGGSLLRQLLPDVHDRPTAGLRLLIGDGDLAPARQACVEIGWQPVSEGPGFDRYLADEGHYWRATNRRGLELDLFYRLWDWAPAHAGRDMLERSTPLPDLRTNGCRLATVDAYLITALRIWATPPPRPLLYWRDLHRIASLGDESLGREVYRAARQAGLKFPVGLAAAITSGLWDHPCHHQVATLLNEASTWEQMVMRLARWRGPERIPTQSLVLARLLSGHSTRTGWRTMTRAVWAHPGVVEHETRGKWPRPMRRAVHVAGSLGRAVKPSGSPTANSP